MTRPIDHVIKIIEDYIPPRLAESWDNVGLLWGDRQQPVTGILTCLTLTLEVAEEALARGANLIVTHHPLPFQPIRQVTTDSVQGTILWRLARGGVSVYSSHTAFDSTYSGINERLAQLLELDKIEPLILHESSDETDSIRVGAGRLGYREDGTTLGQIARQLMAALGLDHVRVVGPDDHPACGVAVACGSGSSLFDVAAEKGARAVVTGEASFHALLSARSAGMGVVLMGHYASERFALEWLAEWIADMVPEVKVEASRAEQDPIRLILPASDVPPHV
jgi:dinuclear metal center YbgI/SA1388 family protein